jgi:hypothetical protein
MKFRIRAPLAMSENAAENRPATRFAIWLIRTGITVGWPFLMLAVIGDGIVRAAHSIRVDIRITNAGWRELWRHPFLYRKDFE